ncbi:hypothetical protein KC721_01990 [Candidatus Woesebacteria bacterium]|nr:hypothetical protein [Candidatus Woesebacteria bacterium]
MINKENPTIRSYVVTYDGGLAPNPSYGVTNNNGHTYLTLSVCKPVIRRTANEGDWIVGLTGTSFENRIVYVMVVSAILSFDEYYKSDEFEYKIPDLKSKNPQIVAGDNFYKPIGHGNFIQLPSLHSNPDGTPNKKHQTRDLSGKSILVAEEYYYYGENAIILPESLSALIVGRGHRNSKEIRLLNNLRRYMDTQTVGIHGKPKLLGKK